MFLVSYTLYLIVSAGNLTTPTSVGRHHRKIACERASRRGGRRDMTPLRRRPLPRSCCQLTVSLNQNSVLTSPWLRFPFYFNLFCFSPFFVPFTLWLSCSNFNPSLVHEHPQCISDDIFVLIPWFNYIYFSYATHPCTFAKKL